MTLPNGYILYRGPSMIDGVSIVVIGTGFSKASTNNKTKNMIQTWILLEDVAPNIAIHTGEDESICGNCAMRGIIVDGRNIERPCYVKTFQAPLSIWKKYQRGGYTFLDTYERFAGRKLRLGSYGDPAAVPLQYWTAAVNKAAGITGYSHQYASSPKFASVTMASADNSQARAAAKKLGFRTFRVMTNNDKLESGEILCPASKEAGHKTTCDSCGLCAGNMANRKRTVPDIAIYAHGSGAGAFARA